MTNFDFKSRDFTGDLPVMLQSLAGSEPEILSAVCFFAANRMQENLDSLCDVHRAGFNSHSDFELSELRIAESCYIKGFCDAVDVFSTNFPLLMEQKTKKELVSAETSPTATHKRIVSTFPIVAQVSMVGGDFYG